MVVQRDEVVGYLDDVWNFFLCRCGWLFGHCCFVRTDYGSVHWLVHHDCFLIYMVVLSFLCGAHIDGWF